MFMAIIVYYSTVKNVTNYEYARRGEHVVMYANAKTKIKNLPRVLYGRAMRETHVIKPSSTSTKITIISN